MRLLTATVHARDGIRFEARADNPAKLSALIVDYIRERCDYVLWSSTAEEVRALIAADKLHAAIAVYFSHVGERWDEEWLRVGDILKAA
jgi:hypothetical protein